MDRWDRARTRSIAPTGQAPAALEPLAQWACDGRAAGTSLRRQDRSACRKCPGTSHREYLAGSSMGLVRRSGVLPMLLPLLVTFVSHRLDFVAYVTGAYNLGLLSAPLIGALAERSGAYRLLFLGGLAVIGVGTTGIPIVSDLGSWLVLGIAVGAGTAAVTVVGNLLIVDFVPAVEWETRLGWLRGSAARGRWWGCWLRRCLPRATSPAGLWVAAATTVPALVVGRIGLPVGNPSVKPLSSPGLGPLPHQAHRLRWADASRLPEMLRHPFGRFLLSWFAYNLGVAAFFAYFPLLMRRGFGITPSVTAIAYAVAAAVGTALFVLAGQWAGRYGDRLLYLAALAVRLLGFGLLGVFMLLAVPGRDALALLGFGLIVLAWPLLVLPALGLPRG